MGQVSLIHTPDLWLEGNAVRQLHTTAELPAIVNVIYFSYKAASRRQYG